jgi:acetylornithine/succinyldiaminopimelate/putrescine aminotransferase
LKAAVTENTAAVIVEPIQGEGGVRPIGNAIGAAIMDACRATGALLIADEVQCGLGRTGQAFCSPAIGLQPDLMAIGKSLGAGVPIAAALFSDRVAAAAAFGDHGSTYGGNLLACRAALVFLDELEAGGLMTHVARVGRHLHAGLQRLQSRHPMIREIRGEGLMWGLDLDRPAAPIVDAAIAQGLLVNRTADTVVRLLPPYIITTEGIDEGIGLLDAAFVAAFGGHQR